MTNKTTTLDPIPALTLFRISNTMFVIVTIISAVLLLLGLVSIYFACKFHRSQRYSDMS